MRQYLLSGAVMGALFAGMNLVVKTAKARFTWQIALLWASWAISLILAIASVKADSNR